MVRAEATCSDSSEFHFTRPLVGLYVRIVRYPAIVRTRYDAQSIPESRRRLHNLGLDNLPQDLERMANQASVHHPPEPGHSENEWVKVNRAQYQGTGQPVDGGQQPQGTGENPPVDQAPDMALSLESATINIHHVDKLIVLHYHLAQDEDGRAVMPGT